MIRHLASLTGLIIRYLIGSYRKSATTEVYDNGTSKENGGYKNNPDAFDMPLLIVVIELFIILILVGFIAIMKYKARKKRKGNILALFGLSVT